MVYSGNCLHLLEKNMNCATVGYTGLYLNISRVKLINSVAQEFFLLTDFLSTSANHLLDY